MKTTYKKKSRRLPEHARKYTKSRKQMSKYPKCRRYFRGQPSLTKHMKDAHTPMSQEMLTCDLCGGTFRDRDSIVKHMESHSKTPVCFCTLCNETFVEFDELEIHVSICRTTKKGMREETHQGLAQGIDEHLSMEVEDEQWPYSVLTNDSCSSDYCLDTVEDVSVKKGSSEEDVVCEFCGIMLKGMFSLTNHYLAHEAKEIEDNNIMAVDQNAEDCDGTRYDPDDQYWTHYSWDSERSLVYPKDSDEFEKSFVEDLTGLYQINQSDVHDVACESVKLINSGSDNKVTVKSEQEFDPTEFHGWTSSGTSIMSKSGHSETNPTNTVFPGIAFKNWISEPFYCEQFGTQISFSPDGTYQSFKWSACYTDQQHAMDTDLGNTTSTSADDFIISLVSNSEIKTIQDGKTISVQSADVSMTDGCFLDNFLSPSKLEDSAAGPADSGSIRLAKTFQCRHCQGWLPSETDLEEHISFAHGEKSCSPVSGQGQKDSLPSKQVEMDEMIGENLKELDLPTELLDYTLVEKVDDKKSCQRCGERYSVGVMHYCNSRFSQTGKDYKCRYCQRKFLLYRSVISHSKVHTEIEKPFKCDRCPKSYLTKSSLDVHHAIHTGGKRECHICGKMVGPAFLNSHARSHNLTKTSEDTSAVCDICGKKFQSMSTLASHQFTQHNVYVEAVRSLVTFEFYKCPHCKEEMQNKPMFIAHVATHTGVYPFECCVCTKGFLYKEVLKVHMTRFHGGNLKKVTCEQCGQDFHISSNRQRHKHRYSLTWSFVCEECGKGFRWRDMYEGHMKMHSGQLPLRCVWCEKTFTVKRNWVAHQQFHAEDKPYRCDQCNEDVREKNRVIAHTKTVINNTK